VRLRRGRLGCHNESGGPNDAKDAGGQSRKMNISPSEMPNILQGRCSST
jgi:hypothetical protein